MRSRRRLSPAEQLVAEGALLQYPKVGRGRSSIPTMGSTARLQRAIEKYSAAIKLDRRLIDAYIRRASARRRIGDLRGARTDSMKAYNLRPSDPLDYLLISFAFPHAQRRRILRRGIASARPGGWHHHQLGINLARTYWYEGRFDLQLRVTRRLIHQFAALGKSRLLPPLHYEAGTALMAMNRFAAAERHLRAAFRDRGTTGMLARASVVESHLYRNDPEAALHVLDEVASRLDPLTVTLTRAYIQALAAEPTRVPAALRSKLLTQRDASRHDYMAAVILLRLGRADVAKPRLRRFIKHCEGNPTEWGVTMRWEVAKAKELLAS
jgi:tetratricopeptide (TPR) repeat protein